jgi:hypothetical protein
MDEETGGAALFLTLHLLARNFAKISRTRKDIKNWNGSWAGHAAFGPIDGLDVDGELEVLCYGALGALLLPTYETPRYRPFILFIITRGLGVG